MSSTFHTPIPKNSPANAMTFNIPLGQFDNAVTKFADGELPFSKASFDNAVVTQISSGLILSDEIFNILEAETGTTDDLDQIIANNNSFIFLKAQTGHRIRLTNVNNLNADNVFLENDEIICLFCENNQWSIFNTSLTNHLSNNLFCSGLEISTNSATNIVTIQPGACSSDNNRVIIETNTELQVNMSVSGIGGLDTGSVSSNTYYYIWILRGASGVGCVASIAPTSPTMPSGYNQYKRRIAAFFTDGSSNMLSGFMPQGQGLSRRFYYTQVANAAPYRMLDNANIGTTGSRTSLSFGQGAGNIVPATGVNIIALLTVNTPSGTCDIFWSESGVSDRFILSCAGTGQISATIHILPIQFILGIAEIYSSASVTEDLSLHVLGWVDEGLINLGYTP